MAPHQKGPRADGRGEPGRATGRIGAVRHQMPDVGRADPLPPYPSAPQSRRPPSCRRHSPAVLQGLGVLPSSVTAPDRHTARPASGVLRWPGDYRARRPALRSVAGDPACRRPGGRRVNTPPSSSLHQCSSQSRSHVITMHTAPTAADLAAAGPGALPALHHPAGRQPGGRRA